MFNYAIRVHRYGLCSNNHDKQVATLHTKNSANEEMQIPWFGRRNYDIQYDELEDKNVIWTYN